MNTFLHVQLKMQELPQDWHPARALQVFEMTPGLADRLALAAGRFFIATGEKLVYLAAGQSQWGEKAV